jgi:hypothetical protein
LHINNVQDVESQLQKFWEQEEVNVVHRTNEERAAENHFASTTIRDHTDRFIVRLPRLPNHASLGDPYKNAEQRFLQLEKKIVEKSQLREDYINFIKEYLQLGHMRPVPSETSVGEARRNNIFFLPHHAVLRPDSTTIKTRVVFDASAKTTSGITVNDILMTGSTIQQVLLSTILRFRTHVYAMTADISKMYRQIKIHPEDYVLQRIIWRDTPAKSLQQYQLITVTYGTASASAFSWARDI